MKNEKLLKINWIISALFVFLFYCPNLLAEATFTPISESTWSSLFQKISNHKKELSDKGKIVIYQDIVTTYSTAISNNATAKLTSGNMKNRNQALNESLIAHLLSWYVSEISYMRGLPIWFENRQALIDNRRALVEIGLNSHTLETSFINMNNAARTLALPTIYSLN